MQHRKRKVNVFNTNLEIKLTTYRLWDNLLQDFKAGNMKIKNEIITMMETINLIDYQIINSNRLSEKEKSYLLNLKDNHPL